LLNASAEMMNEMKFDLIWPWLDLD